MFFGDAGGQECAADNNGVPVLCGLGGGSGTGDLSRRAVSFLARATGTSRRKPLGGQTLLGIFFGVPGQCRFASAPARAQLKRAGGSSPKVAGPLGVVGCPWSSFGAGLSGREVGYFNLRRSVGFRDMCDTASQIKVPGFFSRAGAPKALVEIAPKSLSCDLGLPQGGGVRAGKSVADFYY